MIVVKIEVKVNSTTIEFETEYPGLIGNSTLDAERAQSLLLEGFQKVNRAIESQK